MFSPKMFDVLSGKKKSTEEEDTVQAALVGPTPMAAEADPIEDLFKDGPAMTGYQELLKKTPKREDHKASTMDRIAAALVGGAEGFVTSSPSRAMATSQKIVGRKYNNAMDDFKVEEEGARRSAEMEGHSQGRKIRAHDYKERAADRETDNKRQAQAETNRHNEAMSRAKSAEAKAAEQIRHNKEMERISGVNADANVTRANRPPASSQPKTRYINMGERTKARAQALQEISGGITPEGSDQPLPKLSIQKDDKGNITGVKKLTPGKLWGENEEDLSPEEQEAIGALLDERMNEILEQGFVTDEVEEPEEEEEEL